MTVAALMSFIPCKGTCPECGSSLEKNSLGEVRCSKEGCKYEAVFDQDTDEIISHEENDARSLEREKTPVSRADKMFWLLLAIFVIGWQIIEIFTK